jgi:hypothetical protein
MSPGDITEAAHERGDDGELLPVTRTVEVRGAGEKEVEVIPATTGQRRAWKRRLRDEADEDGDGELGDEVEADLFDEFLPYEPSDFGGAGSWNDIRPALSDAMGNAVFAVLFDVEGDFEDALADAMDEVTEGNPKPATD